MEVAGGTGFYHGVFILQKSLPISGCKSLWNDVLYCPKQQHNSDQTGALLKPPNTTILSTLLRHRVEFRSHSYIRKMSVDVIG